MLELISPTAGYLQLVNDESAFNCQDEVVNQLNLHVSDLIDFVSKTAVPQKRWSFCKAQICPPLAAGCSLPGNDDVI